MSLADPLVFEQDSRVLTRFPTQHLPRHGQAHYLSIQHLDSGLSALSCIVGFHEP